MKAKRTMRGGVIRSTRPRTGGQVRILLPISIVPVR